jgi:hypothetical protein
MKAQSAMEYLTTYGWAILILAIVVLVIVSSGFLTQKPADLCSFQYNFTCTSYYINSNGILNVSITQRTGYNITATYIGCDSNVSSSAILKSISINVPNYGNFSETLQCYYSGKDFNSTIGSSYKGYIIFEYTNSLSGYAHTIAGRIVYNIN